MERKEIMSANMHLALLLSFFCLTLNNAMTAQRADSIFLYEGSIPGAIEDPAYQEDWQLNGIWRVHKVKKPTLSIYLPPKDKAKGSAVIICPGGGYGILAIDFEGHDIARWFNEIGVAAFVLKYRLPHDQIMKDKKYGPLQDAQQAIRLVRKNAAQWNIKPDQVGIMGFSAGGHLASSALTLYRDNVNGLEPDINIRPDFGALIYPVISMKDDFAHAGSAKNLLGANPDEAIKEKFSAYTQIDQNTPPTFLISAADDYGVPPANSYAFFAALQKLKINSELHFYASGGHGFGMGVEGETNANWLRDLKAWMKQSGYLGDD